MKEGGGDGVWDEEEAEEEEEIVVYDRRKGGVVVVVVRRRRGIEEAGEGGGGGVRGRNVASALSSDTLQSGCSSSSPSMCPAAGVVVPPSSVFTAVEKGQVGGRSGTAFASTSFPVDQAVVRVRSSWGDSSFSAHVMEEFGCVPHRRDGEASFSDGVSSSMAWW